MSQEGVMGARRRFTVEYKREAVAMLEADGADMPEGLSVPPQNRLHQVLPERVVVQIVIRLNDWGISVF